MYTVLNRQGEVIGETKSYIDAVALAGVDGQVRWKSPLQIRHELRELRRQERRIPALAEAFRKRARALARMIQI